METRNITITLPVELVRAARVFAAERDTTLNALLREMLQERLDQGGRTRAAIQRMLELSEQVPSSSVTPQVDPA